MFLKNLNFKKFWFI